MELRVLKSFTLRETDEYCCVEWIVPVTCSSPFYDAQKSMAVTQDDIMIHGLKVMIMDGQVSSRGAASTGGGVGYG